MDKRAFNNIAFNKTIITIPLQGCIENHILALRPDPQEDDDGNTSVEVRLLEDCEAETTRSLLAKPKIRRIPAGKGIALAWCKKRDAEIRARPDGEAFPKPDWDLLQDPHLFDNDLPQEPQDEDEGIVLETSLDDIGLIKHQQLMLMPVDMRISELMYPASIQARAREVHNRVQRKSRWAGKLQGHFRGKLGQKWAAKIK